jgi:hypothetical protein
MFDTVNQVQGTTIEAALQKREVTVSNELIGKIQMTGAETSTVSVFEGKGVCAAPKRKRRTKLTHKSLHQLKFVFEYEEENKSDEEPSKGIPYPKPLADEVYDMLPEYYTRLPMEHCDEPQLRDAILHSNMTVTSAALAYCQVSNGLEDFSCNIMSLFASTSTSGKSLLTSPAKVLDKIDKRLREEEKEKKREYDKKMDAYRSMKKFIETKCKPEEMEQRLMKLQEPEPPSCPTIHISSKTGPDLVLRHHNNRGLPSMMTKDEVITLIKDDKREHGDIFDKFLSIVDNAPIGQTIKTNDERLYAERPNMSFVGTMTDDELRFFFDSIPSGLEARVSMRVLNINRKYRPEDEEEYLRHKKVMEWMSDELYDLYFLLRSKSDHGENEKKKVYTLKQTPEMKEQMDRYFDSKTQYVSSHYRCKNAVGVVFRSRLDYKRYLLQVSMMRLREMTGSWEDALRNYQIVPTVEDADLMLYYIDHVINHTLYVLECYAGAQQAYEEVEQKMSLMEIFRQLPDPFISSDAKNLLAKNGVGSRQQYRVINSWEDNFFIEETGRMEHERVFRKLTKKEQQKLVKMSLKQTKKKQSAVNKKNKKR